MPFKILTSPGEKLDPKALADLQKKFRKAEEMAVTLKQLEENASKYFDKMFELGELLGEIHTAAEEHDATVQVNGEDLEYSDESPYSPGANFAGVWLPSGMEESC